METIKQPLQFVKPTSTQTPSGGKKYSGETVLRSCLGWVKKKPLARFTDGGDIRYRNILKVEVWNDASITITPDCLIKYRGENFEILDIDEVSNRFKTIYTATARQ